MTTEDNAWGGTAAADDAWGAPASTETPVADGAPADGEGRRGREREPEEVDNTLTLDQYLAQQKDKELDVVPKLETRKVNHDGELWKDAIALQKTEDEDTYFAGKVSNITHTPTLY